MSKKIKMSVEVMMCEKCKAKVEEGLSSVPGVVSAVADHKKGTAVVEADRDIPDEVLVRAVIDAGFKAKVKHGLF